MKCNSYGYQETGFPSFGSKAHETDYTRGIGDFRSGTPLGKLWPAARRQGWKRARDEELKFLHQVGSTGSERRLMAVGMTRQDIAALTESMAA